MEYFCHACTQQGRLRDGNCGRCGSGFVEEIPNDVELQSHPRRFTMGDTPINQPNTHSNPIEDLLGLVFGAQRRQPTETREPTQNRPFVPPSPPANTATHPHTRRRGYVMVGDPSNPMTFAFGGSEGERSTGSTRSDQAIDDDHFNPSAPSLSDFLANSFQPPPINRATHPETQPSTQPAEGIGIGGYIQSLITSLMGSNDVPEVLFNNGQAHFGDYILSQGAFDRFVDELMQTQDTGAIIPASDERIAELHKGVVDKEWISAQDITDCSICKDDFEVNDTYTSMPCKHAFHPDCLLPWLRHNGTCPVCRHSIAMDREEWDSRRQEQRRGHSRRESDDPTRNMPGSFAAFGVQPEDVD